MELLVPESTNIILQRILNLTAVNWIQPTSSNIHMGCLRHSGKPLLKHRRRRKARCCRGRKRRTACRRPFAWGDLANARAQMILYISLFTIHVWIISYYIVLLCIYVLFDFVLLPLEAGSARNSGENQACKIRPCEKHGDLYFHMRIGIHYNTCSHVMSCTHLWCWAMLRMMTKRVGHLLLISKL